MKVRCDVCVGAGENWNENINGWEKCGVCDGLGEYEYDDSSDYYEDEWSDDDWEDRISETYHAFQLCKSKNGHLVIVETSGYCLWGQDWGETVGQWSTEHIRLNQAQDFIRKAAIHYGKTMKPGKAIDFYWGDFKIVRPVRLLPAFRVMSTKRVAVYF